MSALKYLVPVGIVVFGAIGYTLIEKKKKEEAMKANAAPPPAVSKGAPGMPGTTTTTTRTRRTTTTTDAPELDPVIVEQAPVVVEKVRPVRERTTDILDFNAKLNIPPPPSFKAKATFEED